MDTFELLPSLAQGELSETSSPELVAAVFRSRASGTLWLETEQSNEIRIFFRAGDMCGTGGFNGFKTLALVLLENEWVDALSIDESQQEASAQKKRHGEVLVQKGLLTIEKLREALAAQHRANLSTLLLVQKGKYDWRGWEPPPAWAREVSVDPIGVIVDALEHEQHAARRTRIIDWIAQNRVRLSLDWPELQGRIALGPMERRAAALLALPRNLDEFIHASRLERTRAESLLVALLLAGGAEPQPVAHSEPAHAEPEHAPEEILEPIEPEVLEPFPEPEPEPEPEVLPEPEPEVLPEPELAPEPDPLLAGPDLSHKPRRALVDEDEAISRLDSLSLDEAAPAHPPPPQAEEALELEIDHRPRGPARPGGAAAQAPLRGEVEFDADGAAAAPVEAPAKGADEDRARELRKKMLQRGLRNLGTMPSALSAPRQQEEQGNAVAEEPPAPAAPLDADTLTDEDRRFVVEVRNKAKLVEGQNAYARLGVTPTSTTEQIKQAYIGAAKRYHPDRSSTPGLKGLQPELQKVFAALKDAYDQLASAEARVRYDQQLKVSGGAPPKPQTRRDEAVVAMKMGEVLLKKRDFDGALNKLRRAVDLDPTGDTMAALAWGIVSDPKATPATKEEAASLINRALRAPGVTARTFYVAGVLWRTKDPDSAVDAFRKALEMDPNHSDAALELRLIEQRRGKAQKGGGVLSGLLFGKKKA